MYPARFELLPLGRGEEQAAQLPQPAPLTVAIGTEVTLVWGEEGGGSAKPVVERHDQAELRAVVSPCPYSEVARTSYAEGWRSKTSVT